MCQTVFEIFVEPLFTSSVLVIFDQNVFSLSSAEVWANLDSAILNYSVTDTTKWHHWKEQLLVYFKNWQNADSVLDIKFWDK